MTFDVADKILFYIYSLPSSISKSFPSLDLSALKKVLCHSEEEWFFIPKMMEVDKGSSCANEKKPFEGSTLSNEAKKPADNVRSSPVFINHAVIAWHENRRKWTGDPSLKSQRMQKDSIISWSMTYEDLLSTHDPFTEPIPLAEMVDFLVDIWHDEGLDD